MLLKKVYTFFIILIFLFQKNSFCQSGRIDSLKNALKITKNDSISIVILNKLLENDADPKMWSVYNDQLIKISERNTDKLESGLDSLYYRNLATALNNKAGTNYVHGDIIGSLELFERALTLYQKLEDKNGIGACLINMGGTFDNQGDMTKALEYYHKSLKILEETNNKEGLTVCFINLGNIYKKLKDFNTALNYYIYSLKLSTESKDKKGIAASFNYIGIIFNYKGDSIAALDYFTKSLKIREEIHDKMGIAQSLNNIGNIYKQQKNFEKALDYFTRSLAQAEEVRDKKTIANTLDNIAQTYLFHDEVNKAYAFAKQGFDLAKKLESPKIIMNSALTMKRIFQKQNKFKDAFEMFELEIKMRDSINNQETQKAAIKKQMQYTYEKKELETKAEQDKKDVIAKQKLKQKENERNYFIVGFGLVAVLALFILRGYKQKQKANAIILKQKILVEKKQKEILDSIHYAKRIQAALLPSEKYINRKIKQKSIIKI